MGLKRPGSEGISEKVGLKSPRASTEAVRQPSGSTFVNGTKEEKQGAKQMILLNLRL